MDSEQVMAFCATCLKFKSCRKVWGADAYLCDKDWRHRKTIRQIDHRARAIGGRA
jgi:hypothetical protein